MTSFFVPGDEAGTDSERAYADLRARTERWIGQSPRATRIYAIDARHEGVDMVIRVGELGPGAGETVRAIFATSLGYTIISDCGHVDLARRQVYEAIPFD